MIDVNQLFLKVKEQAGLLNIPFSQNIEQNVCINTRSVRRFGQCRRNDKFFTIEVSAFLLEADEKFVMQTLAHELLHTCYHCQNHGVLWRKYADKMNKAYGYSISRTAGFEETGLKQKRQTAKYCIQCMGCGAKIERYRMSRLVSCPELYRCKCGGRLKRIL